MTSLFLRIICTLGIFYITYIILIDIVNPILDILFTNGGSPLNGPLSWQKILIYSLDLGIYMLLIWLNLPPFQRTTSDHQ